MSKLESAKEIIRQDGSCVDIHCDDCVQNNEGMYPCQYAESLTLCGSKEHYKVKVDFCKERLKENEMKFKIGDWVNSKYFKGVKQIDNFIINCAKEKRALVIGEEGRSYSLKNLTLVCGFKKGERVIAENGTKNLEFYAYDPELKKPFLVRDVSENSYDYDDIYNCRNIKLESKYKPYKEPKLEWLKKHIKRKSDGLVFEITSICKEKTIRISDASGELGKRFTTQELLDEFVWLNSSPFGVEV